MTIEADGFHSLFLYFCQHLVCLVYKHEPTRTDDTEGREIEIGSGFIMEFQGHWYLATAGHHMEKLEKLRKARPDRRIVVTILDGFGEGVINNTMVPLDYFGAKRYHVYDEQQGLDFGLIYLRENTCQLLEANSRIPVPESHWRDWSEVDFASYSIIGALVEGSYELPPNGISVNSAQFDLSPIESPPASLQRFTQPMRFFKLNNLGDTKSIVGMSGCPILGIRVNVEPLQMDYHFIGIQSGWLSESRIIYACDLAHIAKSIISEIGSDPD